MKEQPKSRAYLAEADKYDSCNFCASDEKLHLIRSDRALVICICNDCLIGISISRVSGEPPKPAVFVSRISDLVHKCADWKDGEITGFRMEEFEIRLFVILEKLSGEAKTVINPPVTTKQPSLEDAFNAGHAARWSNDGIDYDYKTFEDWLNGIDSNSFINPLTKEEQDKFNQDHPHHKI